MSDCLLLRADASTQTGTGHVMRCLALAQAWRRIGGSALFAAAEMTPALEKRLANEGFSTARLPVTPGAKEDAARTGELARNRNAAWVVADSYHFGLEYQRAIKAAGLRLLILDDYGHAGQYVADCVLNQNLGAEAALYASRAPHTRLLLGTRYALLREEFRPWRDWQRDTPAVARKILVTLGGSDPDNVTRQVIAALMDFSEIEAKVVIGGSNPHLDQLKAQIGTQKPIIELVENATNMPELMAWADVAIAAGGSTCWEIALLGLPMLLLILADNQSGIAEGLAAHGNAISLGWRHTLDETTVARTLGDLLLDEKRRQKMSRLGQELVDGFGASRVATILKEET